MIPGKTRSCPHCKATILESAAVCPGCQHHLRFDSQVLERMVPAGVPLRVEGSIRHPPEGGPWEYSIMLVVRNEQGEELSRQVVGVGAMRPQEQRTFSLTVELFAPRQAGATDVARAEDPHARTGTGFNSPFRDPRVRPAVADAAGPPPLPRDPRPPAPQSQVRVLPGGTRAPKPAATPAKPPEK